MTFLQKRGWPLLFNLLFWTPFWLFPLAATRLKPELRYPLSLLASHVLGGLLITAGLAALAELCGRRRRWFFLGAGAVCWIGAQAWTLFLFGSTSVINSYTIATVAQYLNGDGAETSYIYISPWCLLPLTGATLPFLLLWRHWRALDWQASWRGALAGTMLAALVLPLDLANRYHQGMGDDGHVQTPVYRIDLFVPGESYYGLYRYLGQLSDLRRYQAQRLLLSRDRGEPLTLIVLVGESTARSRMSLYGYCRDTTPRLKAPRPGLTVFDNLVSNFPLTLFSLYHTFSLPSVPTARGPDRSTLFKLLAAAGFRTEWVSNQYKYGGPTDITTTLMSTTQRQAWVRRYQGRADGYTKDSLLLPWIARAMDDPAPRNATFFHLMGTHLLYSDRYPPDFARPWPAPASGRTAAQRRAIDDYDTAVRFQDQVLDDAIRLAEQRGETRNIALIYFSDHGEEVYEQYPILLHAYPDATRSMVESPLLIWLSPALRRARPGLAQAVEAAYHRRLQTRDLSPLMLDLAGVRTRGDTLSHPLSPAFREGLRLVGVRDYDRDPDLGRTPTLPPLCR